MSIVEVAQNDRHLLKVCSEKENTGGDFYSESDPGINPVLLY